MSRRPIVVVTCCWIIGVSLLSLFDIEGLAITLIAFILLFIGISVLTGVKWKLTLVCIVSLTISCGERVWLEQGNASDLMLHEVTADKEAAVIGYISSLVEVDGDVALFRMKASSIQFAPTLPNKLNDTIIVRVKLTEISQQKTASLWERGDHIQITGQLELPGTAGNFGAFDYRSYLKKQGIYWQLTSKGTSSLVLTEGDMKLSMKGLRALDQFREEISEIMDRLYTLADAGYMKGLVVGIRSDLDPEQFDDFARLGLTHVLAISGLHVAVIVFILLQMGAWMRLTRERTLELTIAFMPIYMLITGASPSAVRACLMAMLALWLARRHALKDGLHLLAAAALLMLIWNPALIGEVSFQLSFIVTAGLLLFVPTVTDSLPFRWKWLRGSIAVTLTAQIVSFPLTAYYFHSAHLLSLPTNFLLVPFISFVVMPLGLVSIVLGAIWIPLGVIPAKLATMGNQLTFTIVDFLSRDNKLRTVWPQPSLLWVVAAYVLMGVGIYLLRLKIANRKEREWWKSQSAEPIRLAEEAGITAPLLIIPSELAFNKRRVNIYLLLFSMITASWLVWGFRPEGLNRNAAVSFINVGQGDSILIRGGEGKYVLIDAGGTVNFRKPGEEWRVRSDPYEVGRKLLVPLLLKRGIRELDALVLTHLDADHIGGAAAIIEQIPVRALLINGTIKDAPASNHLFQLALDMAIPIYSVQASMDWEVDPTTTISVLYPEETGNESDQIALSSDQNERSIVLLVSLYGRQFLLPGDLESKGEQAIVEAQIKLGETKKRHIDVLKAGHHGSKTSTTAVWLNYWRPRETVISVGLNNVYGHPHPTVLKQLSAVGSTILRTDLDGEIQYRISPEGTMVRRALYTGVYPNM